MLTLKVSILVFLHRVLPIFECLHWFETPTMGVIWNPEKISYMLDTHIIDFGEFQFFWGEGGVGTPLWRGGGRG